MPHGQQGVALRRLVTVLAVVVLAAGAAVVGLPLAASAKDGWTLTGVCTPVEDYPELRRFVILNETGVGRQVELRNTTNDESVFVFATPGESVHLVPAKATGSNLTQLWVDGENKDVDQAVNVACGVLKGLAVCIPGRGQYQVTWTVTNNDGFARPILSVSPRRLTFDPDPVPAEGGTAQARETVDAPDTGATELTLTVEMGLGGGERTSMTEGLVLGVCGDPVPPEISFTFTKTASVAAAGVGDTITYTYAGANTGEVPLEVTQLLDHDLGIVISDPSVATIVPPGGSLSRQVDYTVTAEDAIVGSIDNAAVVTVRATEGPDQAEKSETATETVRVVQPPRAVLTGTATCNPATGAFDVIWTLSNDGSRPFTIQSTSRPITFSPAAVPVGTTATASETVVPSGPNDVLTLNVTVVNEFGDGAQASESLTLGQCEPPLVGFTFTKTPDRATATLGETITYTYAGTNTGAVPLQVTQLVDDRLGVVVDTATVVAPGDSLSTTVQHVVTEADVAAGAIDNTAVVTAHATEGPDQADKSATARAHVDVTAPPAPVGPVELAGTALCDQQSGRYQLTWTLTNDGRTPVSVLTTTPRSVAFSPQPINPGATATATEAVTPSSRTQQVSLTVTVDDSGTPTTPPAEVSASVVLGVCQPAPPPVVDFTFTKTADRRVSRIGQTITYTYRGTNIGSVPLEVTQLVDDQLGVLIRRPERTVVQPGHSITQRVRHVTTAIDASARRIHNAAVVSVIPVGGANEISGVALARVRVVPPPAVVEPPLVPEQPASVLPDEAATVPAVGGEAGALPDVGGPPILVAFLGLTSLCVGTTTMWWSRHRR